MIEQDYMDYVKNLECLEKGDKVLFESRKKPLEVIEVSEEGVLVEGPNGGQYRIYDEEGAEHFLIANPGKEKYASYCKKLRKIGEWNKEDDKKWIHSDTGAKVELFKNNAGFWNIRVEKLNEDFELPKYGFLDFENAKEEAEKIVENNPEGC